MDSLIHDINAFCERHGMSASRFGMLALNDKAFVHQIRGRRRRVWPETESKVRNFMRTYQPSPQETRTA